MPPLLPNQEDERKRQQKEARHLRIAEYGRQSPLFCSVPCCAVPWQVIAASRYKRGDEMRSMNAADAEDKDYELRLLKVGKGHGAAAACAVLPLFMFAFVTVPSRSNGWLSKLRRRGNNCSRCLAQRARASCHLTHISLLSQRDRSREDAAVGKILKHKVARSAAPATHPAADSAALGRQAHRPGARSRELRVGGGQESG